MIFLILLIAGLSVVTAQSSVAMVFSLSRHGARNVLPKNLFLSDNNSFGGRLIEPLAHLSSCSSSAMTSTYTGPALLPQGQYQQYQAGSNYQLRYISNITCSFTSTCILRWLPTGSTNGENYGLVNASGVGFNNYNTIFRSSVLDRTKQSAVAFLAGIFPSLASQGQQYFIGGYLPSGQQVIPVYSSADIDSNDVTIRAYASCNSFSRTLASWYLSQEFASKANETLTFRNSILQAYLIANISAPDTSLTNWYNVWDSFNVYRSYGVGDAVPNITAVQFSDMQALAYWLEVSKMRSSMAGNMLGGTVLQMAVDAMLDVNASIATAFRQTSKASSSFYQLVGLHGHYNTQLGLLAALKLDQHLPAVNAFAVNSPTGSWLSTGSSVQVSSNLTFPPPKLPSAAAVLSFELLAPSNTSLVFNQSTPSSLSPPTLAVRLVVQDGPGRAYFTLPLPCTSPLAAAIGGQGSCTLDAFINMVSSHGMTLQPSQWCIVCANNAAEVCVATQAKQELDSLNTVCRPKYPGWTIAVTAVLACLLLLAMEVGVWYFFFCVRRRRGAKQIKVGQRSTDEEDTTPTRHRSFTAF
jgi:lysosomal acid phosphatase